MASNTRMIRRMDENKQRVTITLDPDLLRRIDAICEQSHEPRSSFMERKLRVSVEESEDFLRDMENPLYRGLARAMLTAPEITAFLARALGEQLTPEQVKRVKKELPKQIELGRKRQTSNKRGQKGTAPEGA